MSISKNKPKSLIEKYRAKGYKLSEEKNKEREQELMKKNKEKKKEFQESLKSLENYLEKTSRKLEKSGIPVKKDCRIDFQSDFFKDFKKQNKDIKKAQNLEKELEIKTNKQKAGEQLEMLKTGLFDKFLGESIYVLRSSKYDDYFNSIDNVLIDKKSGEMVCAFDEVAFKDRTQDQRLHEKKMKLYKINVNGGGKLDYGLKIEKNKIKPSKIENIPVFYISFPLKILKRAIQKFDTDQNFNKKLFNVFMKRLNKQIENECYINNPPKGSEKRTVKVKKEWRKRLDIFSDILQKK